MCVVVRSCNRGKEDEKTKVLLFVLSNVNTSGTDASPKENVDLL
jgi:hypothetical protein